jgi:hypothetical protein
MRRPTAVCPRWFVTYFWLLCLCVLTAATPAIRAQVDQGTITGVVSDASGAVLADAQVTLSETATGFTLERKTNGSGIFIFSPLKIGTYKVTATAPGFKTSSREHIALSAQSRLSVDFTLSPGDVVETMTVTDSAPLLETQTGSVGQVIDSKQINEIPLNGRNWVYLAQLTAGVTPTLGGTRGAGKGDYIANGQRAEQNNFLLDGVDNNTNLVDFLNGSSYVMRPPPDALSEFKVQTSSFSAEFGHSAGSVMNASLKSGTNRLHGSVWEYFRDTSLNAQDWNALKPAPLHQNQFGATLGLPLIKNKLFYFGDIEANRIRIAQTGTYTVPTARMRTGDFSELLDTSLTGSSSPVQLYTPGSGGTELMSCNDNNNVMCSAQIDSVASGILNLYPDANANGGKTYNNLVENVDKHDDTVQWDQRVDWNMSEKNQIYGRYSYGHEIILNGLPLGSTLDGSGWGGERDTNLSQNVMLSETHIFNPTTTNEFRFGYNWGVFRYLQANATKNNAPDLGLGGVPYSPYQGGLPYGSVSGISAWGSQGTANEKQNVSQILDNITKILGNHALKVGVALQNVRFYYTYAAGPRGQYYYNGSYTSYPGTSFTGYGVADFLGNKMAQSYISNAPDIHDQRWYNSGYAQDDWRVLPKLTVNLGVRYEYYQPYAESKDRQANFVITGAIAPGSGTGQYQLATNQADVSLGQGFLDTLALSNVSVEYGQDKRLVEAQKWNFAPRIGFAYSLSDRLVVRGGFGIFFGGLQSEGNSNMGANYPFAMDATLNQPDCSYGNCPSLAENYGVTLENGMAAQLASGLENFTSSPGLHAMDRSIKTPYTETYNVSVEYGVGKNMVAAIGYVGNVSRHLSTYFNLNSSMAVQTSAIGSYVFRPFPKLGGIGAVRYAGISDYNSLQAKIEKKYSQGLSFLGTYTWAHSLDDTSSAGGLSSGVGVRQYYVLGIGSEYTNSPYDVRHRLTLTGSYDLPVGKGKRFLNNDSRVLNAALGGWASSATFVAQTGTPFTVYPNITTANGGDARAILVGDPFKAGGTPDATNPNVDCASKTRTKDHWYNPCAFANPLAGNIICPQGTDAADCPSGYIAPIVDPDVALKFYGGKGNVVAGPGYWRSDVALFKNFTTIKEHYLQFRTDAFNVFNHPTWGNPSSTDINTSGGAITGTKSFQSNTPDSRFLQLSLKYVF